MIIAISGDAGSGKSTIAKMLGKELGFKTYSVGGFMRQIAKKRGKTLLEISRLAEQDPSIDEELDEMQKSLKSKEQNFILDSRLGWHFLEGSYKIFLKTDVQESARRIYEEKRGLEKENTTLQETAENIKKRKSSEIQRYSDYYGVNPYDERHYDLLIDTTSFSAEQVVEKIKQAVEDVSQEEPRL